jgi:hypothetical protein
MADYPECETGMAMLKFILPTQRNGRIIHAWLELF